MNDSNRTPADYVAGILNLPALNPVLADLINRDLTFTVSEPEVITITPVVEPRELPAPTFAEFEVRDDQRAPWKIPYSRFNELDAKKVARIRELYEQGLNTSRIGAMVGISSALVSKTLTANGVEGNIRRRGQKITDQIIGEMVHRSRQLKQTPAEISEAMGWSESSITKHLTARGVAVNS